MTETKRLGRKGRADVRVVRDTGEVVYLTAYEIRAAYRALYAERPRKPKADETEIERALSGKVPA